MCNDFCHRQHHEKKSNIAIKLIEIYDDTENRIKLIKQRAC